MIQNDTSAAAAAGINQTPTLIVNGQKIVGVPSYDQLAALIQAMASPAPSSAASAAS